MVFRQKHMTEPRVPEAAVADVQEEVSHCDGLHTRSQDFAPPPPPCCGTLAHLGVLRAHSRHGTTRGWHLRGVILNTRHVTEGGVV